MNIYELKSDHNYRSLTFKDDDWQDTQFWFKGEARAGSWLPRSVHYLESGKPIADMPPFLPNLPVVSETAKQALETVLTESAEFLPLASEGSPSLFALNVTKLVAGALDTERSKLRHFRNGRIMQIITPAFIEESLQGLSIFRLAEFPSQIYVNDSLRSLVVEEQLSGWKFKLAWPRDEVHLKVQVRAKRDATSHIIRERNHSEAEHHLLLSQIEEGYKSLEASSDHTPGEVVTLISNRLKNLSIKGKNSTKKFGHNANNLGILWGEQVCRAYGWHWAELIFEDNGAYQQTAVVSPDKAYCILPINFIWKHLESPKREETIALLFNMLAEPGVKSEPCSYQVLS